MRQQDLLTNYTHSTYIERNYAKLHKHTNVWGFLTNIL